MYSTQIPNPACIERLSLSTPATQIGLYSMEWTVQAYFVMKW